MKNTIEIDFDDYPVNHVHLSKFYYAQRQDVSLTDVLPSGSADWPQNVAPCDYCTKRYFSLPLTDHVPFACNFNLPLEHCKNHTITKFDNKTNSVKSFV